MLEILSLINRITLCSVFMVSMILAFIGFHNTDMCANGMMLNAELGETGEYGETYLNGSMVTFTDCYRQGMFFIIMADVLMLTSLLVLIVSDIQSTR